MSDKCRIEFCRNYTFSQAKIHSARKASRTFIFILGFKAFYVGVGKRSKSGRQEYSLAGGASGLAFPWIMGSPRLTDPAHSGIFTQVSILSAARLLIRGAVCVCGCMCS